MNSFTELLSKAARRKLYIIYGLLGVGFGATQTAYLELGTDAPVWLQVSFSVYMYIGIAFGLVAAYNVDDPSSELPDVVNVSTTTTTPYLGNHGIAEFDEFAQDQVYDTEPEEPLVEPKTITN